MNRRNFIHLSTLGAVASVIVPNTVFACAPNMAGGVYYTKESPGRWSKKVGGHLPDISVTKRASGVRIKVMTPHAMNGYEHYIIKHVLLNHQFEFIAEKSFNPMQDKVPVSEFSLTNYQGQIHVLSVCNKHDTWLNTTIIT